MIVDVEQASRLQALLTGLHLFVPGFLIIFLAADFFNKYNSGFCKNADEHT